MEKRIDLKLKLVLKDVKQIDVAREAGVNRSFISLILAGKEKPSPKVVKAFKRFGIEVGDD